MLLFLFLHFSIIQGAAERNETEFEIRNNLPVVLTTNQLGQLRDSFRFIAFELYTVSSVLDHAVTAAGGGGPTEASSAVPSIFQAVNEVLQSKKKGEENWKMSVGVTYHTTLIGCIF
jgi:hypothetical protein